MKEGLQCSLQQFVVVKNPLGLHVRPAAIIARLLKNKKSLVQFIYQGKQANARSMMDLLTLGALEGSQILIKTEGEEAEETLKILVDLFETGFENG